MRRYVKNDYLDLCIWYRGHGQKPPKPEELPETGLIVPGICAGFLYKTDANIALVEGLIANKDASTVLRGRALCSVIDSLINTAKEQGFCKVFAFTQLEVVVGLAELVGAKRAPGDFKLIVKEF